MSINIDRLKELSKKVRGMPHLFISDCDHSITAVPSEINFFNMKCWASTFDHCNTVGCLAGVTVLLWGGDESKYCNHSNLRTRAIELLNLTDRQAYALFSASEAHGTTDRITPDMAADCLDFIVENWSDEEDEEMGRANDAWKVIERAWEMATISLH